VPANFDDGQRFATREAARIAGLDVLRIVNEPTAAAVAYGLTASFEGRALVFDLGGGTFDVSILEVAKGVYEVKGTGGDTSLGGEDFDNRIVEWLLAQVPEAQREIASRDRVSLQRLKHAAEAAKRTLTDQTDALISVTDLGDHSVDGGTRFATLETNLTRDFFEQLSEPLSKRCVEVCEKVMRDAKLERSDIDAVLLVGGMTRVPLVRKLTTEFFGKQPVSGVNPDEVVALGAAVHAAELASQVGAALLIDVATHTLSVGVLGGTVRRLIKKNTAVPAVAKEIFYPGKHGQTEVRIPVFQGESDYTDENARLGELVLNELSGIRRSDVPIEVTFELSVEGTLSARAVDTTTGMAEAIRIEARTTLQPHELEQLQTEQGQYATVQGERNKAAALDHFPRMLDKAERLAQLLQKGEDDSAPSPEAQNAVGNLQAVIAQGRAALKAEDLVQMAEVTRVLEKLFAAV
jgi:molecular chaperone DnaK